MLLLTLAETMDVLMHPSYHDIAIATMTKKILSDAEEDIKEIGFKDSQSMMKAVPRFYLYICKFKLMYSLLKGEESSNLSAKTQSEEPKIPGY